MSDTQLEWAEALTTGVDSAQSLIARHKTRESGIEIHNHQGQSEQV